jgi:hypothetical protein
VQRVAEIRRKAKGLAGLAGAMFIIAALKFIFSLADSNSSPIGSIVCLVLGILFFIASQAMYLRANTEK